MTGTTVSPWLPQGVVGGSATAQAQPSPQRSLARRALIVFLFLSMTVFGRFGINLGSYSLSFSLFAVYGLVLVALVSGNLAISPRSLLAYCACVAVGILSLVVNMSLTPADRSSVTSLLLLAAIYLPLIFVLWPQESKEQELLWTMRVFSNVVLFCGLAGIAQFWVQFVVHGDWLFDFSRYIPDALKQVGVFNTVIPVGHLYKSNGFFFREPSGASFLMALGLLVELAYFHRPLRMAALALALVLTYSGTGLLALLIGIVFSVRLHSVGRLSALLAVAGLCAWAAGDYLNLSFTLNRIDEFGSEQSSAYQRYVAPMRLVQETLFAHPWSFWLGLGPGVISRLSQTEFAFHDPTWAKLLVEYGVLGFAAFLVLMAARIRQRVLPVQLRAVLFFSWLIMGGHLLTPDAVYLVVALSGLVGASSFACTGSTHVQVDAEGLLASAQGVAWVAPR